MMINRHSMTIFLKDAELAGIVIKDKMMMIMSTVGRKMASVNMNHIKAETKKVAEREEDK